MAAVKILLIGKDGQLGRELESALATVGDLTSVGRREIDISSRESIRQIVRDARPQLIINAAAYTDVDKAEGDPENAHAVNAVAPGIMVEEANKNKGALIHYSTDYVFDGEKNEPYTERDATGPLNIYGKTKLDGECSVMVRNLPHLIFRTSSLYATHGNSFFRTILGLAREREEIEVVNDQTVSPTSARAVAEATRDILMASDDPVAYIRENGGTYNMSCSGQATWFEFAEAIIEKDPEKDVHKVKKLIPVSSAQYGAKAPRPAYSVLDNAKLRSTFGLTLPSWQECLDTALEQGRKAGDK